jgi:hypothetical protein
MNDSKIELSMVINTAYGGFSLSKEAQLLLIERKGERVVQEDKWGGIYINSQYKTIMDITTRYDPMLVAVVRELGEKAGEDLEVVDITINIEIESYDGKETVKISGGCYQ